MDYGNFLLWRHDTGKKSLIDLFRKNLPGIICWFIWKTYSSIIWGNGGDSPNPDKIILQIKLYTQTWISGISISTYREIGNVLADEGLIPRNFTNQHFRMQIIKWVKPRKKCKLNVDASYLSGNAFGGAIMRDENGGLRSAISFPVQASSPLDAELRAIFFAVDWAIDLGFESFQVETDSALALKYIEGKAGRRWEDRIQATTQICFSKRITFRHTLREGNWAAHHLAQIAVDSPKIYSQIDQLPIFVKRSYWMDFYGIPSFRY
ncbi:unnamed protein product [Cuscuta epithymum]|uniref:RNase H type-1 domain-containing protein n=1 Tax=Cuscuta epithymum TaxID=186058 RepID=A0AAV0DK26_9ASTE|nr:unnamed protein product [Cuscuta epithymum]